MYDNPNTSLADKLTRLCNEHLHHHVFEELKLVKDDFNETMLTREMGAALDANSRGLQEVFAVYAAADQEGDGTAAGSLHARATLETMNVKELNEMCEDINIFDQNFTTMQLLSIFCKVNIDDDLYEKEDDDDDEADSAELVFDEFEEVSSSGSTRTLTLPSLTHTLSLPSPTGGRAHLQRGRLPTDDAFGRDGVPTRPGRRWGPR